MPPKLVRRESKSQASDSRCDALNPRQGAGQPSASNTPSASASVLGSRVFIGDLAHGDVHPYLLEPDAPAWLAQPDRPRSLFIGGVTLLPAHGLSGGPRAGQKRSSTATAPLAYLSGPVQPPQQADILGRSPVFRQVQQGPAGPAGVRRPHQRRPHAQVRLDQHRPAPDRQARSVTRRPYACRILGPATAQNAPADQTAQWLHRVQDGRCSICKSTLTAVEDRPQNPTRVGTLAGDHPQDDRRRVGPQHAGQGRTPPHTPPLPHWPRPGTSARPTAIRACPSRMPGNWQVRFLEGPGGRKAPGLPDTSGHAGAPVRRRRRRPRRPRPLDALMRKSRARRRKGDESVTRAGMPANGSSASTAERREHYAPGDCLLGSCKFRAVFARPSGAIRDCRRWRHHARAAADAGARRVGVPGGRLCRRLLRSAP
jgi:hypothetical protein